MIKFLNQATQDIIEVRGHKLKTYVLGNGPIRILLIHGWESNSWRWRKFIRSMGMENYTFICIDAPAHGASSGKTFDMRILLEGIYRLYQEYQPHVIIGHSMGGMANLLHAAHYPVDKELKLICLASPHSLEYIFGLYYKAIGIGTRMRKNTKSYFEKIYGIKLDYFNVEKVGNDIENALLIVHDIDDNLNSIDCAKSNHNTIKQSTFISIKGSNHSLQSEEVFSIIKSWLKD
jgi:esterase/lipase